MMNTIFMGCPEGLARDVADARLTAACPGALLRFGPQASLEISYETEAESRSAAIHEAANILRALMAETDSICVSAVALDTSCGSPVITPLQAGQVAQHRPDDGLPFVLQTGQDVYACVYGAATEDPEA